MTPLAPDGKTATSHCEITAVEVSRADAQLVQAEVETPSAGLRSETWALPISGWAVGRSSPAVHAKVASGEVPAWELPVHDRRPDIEAQHPDSEWARYAGFSGAVSALRLRPEFELAVSVQLEDGARSRVASIRGRRARLRSSYEPELQPLMVTTLGRTGSTWLVHLLGTHPRVVAYRPFSFEPRAATYWIDVLTSLSEPASYTQQVDAEIDYPRPWWLGSGIRMTSERLPDEALSRWLGSESVDQLAAFAHERIDAFYLQVAITAERERPSFFAEKCLPDNNVPQLLWELYEDAREVFLVRDFRDMVCSIRSFNDKRGSPAFGAAGADTEASYVRETLGPSVARLLDEWRARRDRAHLVRYEELVAHPSRTVAGVLAYLGLDSSTEVVDAMLARAGEEMPAMGDHRTAASVQASVGRWREELPDELRALCEEVFGSALDEFGYPVSGNASRP
jgi:hypothetical protein